MKVIYFAQGEKYLQEAQASIRSLIEHEPDAKVRLFTNVEAKGIADGVEVHKIDHHADVLVQKVYCLSLCDLEANLLLDTDTLVVRPFLNEINSICEGKDFGLAKMPSIDWSIKPPKVTDWNVFSAYNTGVVFFDSRRNPVQSFLQSGHEMMIDFEKRHYRSGGDQSSFNRLSKVIPLEIADLDCKVFNVRPPLCNYVIANLNSINPAIFHGRNMKNFLAKKYGVSFGSH